jgi:ankyrin repeat protein
VGLFSRKPKPSILTSPLVPPRPGDVPLPDIALMRDPKALASMTAISDMATQMIDDDREAFTAVAVKTIATLAPAAARLLGEELPPINDYEDVFEIDEERLGPMMWAASTGFALGMIEDSVNTPPGVVRNHTATVMAMALPTHDLKALDLYLMRAAHWCRRTGSQPDALLG